MDVKASPVEPASAAEFDALLVRRSRGAAVRAWLRRHLTLVIGLVLVAVLLLIAAFGPLLTPYDPNNGNIMDSLTSPNSAHFFGTDYEGRDMFTRVIYGARLAMGPSAVALR